MEAAQEKVDSQLESYDIISLQHVFVSSFCGDICSWSSFHSLNNIRATTFAQQHSQQHSHCCVSQRDCVLYENISLFSIVYVDYYIKMLVNWKVLQQNLTMGLLRFSVVRPSKTLQGGLKGAMKSNSIRDITTFCVLSVTLNKAASILPTSGTVFGCWNFKTSYK